MYAHYDLKAPNCKWRVTYVRSQSETDCADAFQTTSSRHATISIRQGQAAEGGGCRADKLAIPLLLFHKTSRTS